MPDEKEIAEKTHRDDYHDTNNRVFACMAGEESTQPGKLTPHQLEEWCSRNSRLLGHLIQLLETKRLLTAEQVTELLYESVR